MSVKLALTKIVMWWKNTFFHCVAFLLCFGAIASAQDDAPPPPGTELEHLHAIWLLAIDCRELLHCAVVAIGVLIGLACSRALVSRWAL